MLIAIIDEQHIVACIYLKIIEFPKSVLHASDVRSELQHENTHTIDSYGDYSIFTGF